MIAKSDIISYSKLVDLMGINIPDWWKAAEGTPVAGHWSEEKEVLDLCPAAEVDRHLEQETAQGSGRKEVVDIVAGIEPQEGVGHDGYL